MPSGEDVRQVAAVEPLAGEDGAGGVGETGFEQAEVAALEAGELGGAHVGDHGRHLAGRELGDGLHVAAVFVAEGDVAEQVLDGGETLGLEHGGARRADAFDVSEGGGEVHRRGQRLLHLVYNAVVKTLRRYSLQLSFCALRRRPPGGHHRHGHVARPRLHQVAERRRIGPAAHRRRARGGGLQGRQQGRGGQREPGRQVRQGDLGRSTASRSCPTSRRCSRRWTRC